MLSLLSLTPFVCSPAAQAQYPGGGSGYSVTVSGGTVDGKPFIPHNTPYPGSTANTTGCDYTSAGEANGHAVSCSVNGVGPVTATAIWNGGTANTPAPPAAIAMETSVATWSGTVGDSPPFTFTNDPGLGPGIVPVSSQNGETYYQNGNNYFSSTSILGTKYSGQSGSGFTSTCSLNGTLLGTTGINLDSYMYGTAQFSYSLIGVPVTISLPGTTPDSTGLLHILIGQKCSASLVGVPVACSVSNIKWTVSGETIQGDSWLASIDDSSATFPGPFGPYTYTQATSSATPPVWYWDDNGGQKTVNCTATITPPTGQGAAFTITLTKNVTLDEPTYFPTYSHGVVELNIYYLGDPGNLWLSAGGGIAPAPAPEQADGVGFLDSVLTPANPYGGGGTWYHIQLASFSRFVTPLATQAKPNPLATQAKPNPLATQAKPNPLPIAANGNAVKGALDGPPDVFPDPPTFKFTPPHPADGTSLHHDNDSPGISISPDNYYGEYNIKNETYQDYVMYIPPVASTPPPANVPGSNCIDVPLKSFTWGWNVDVKIPPAPLPQSWVNWNDAPTGGTITPPGNVMRQLLYPTWPSRLDTTFPPPP